MTADRGEGRPSEQLQADSTHILTGDGGGDAGIVKATFRKDVRAVVVVVVGGGKERAGELEKWLPAAEMTHPEKRKSLSWAARGGDQSQTVYGENLPPCFWFLVFFPFGRRHLNDLSCIMTPN